MQIKKLAVICNLCFWLTLFFQFWKNARLINPHILNTIIILGIISVIMNIIWLAGLLSTIKSSGWKAQAEALNGFVATSFLAQLIFIAIKCL